jgi:hypothetical protein
MQPISTVASRDLTWVRASKRPLIYELRVDDAVVAALRWQRGSLAEAEAATGEWTFKRAGFWHPRVTVRVAGTETDMAQFTPGWTGAGALRLADQRQFGWKAANFWHSQWSWVDGAGQPVMTFAGGHGAVPAEGHVEITMAALDLPELALLAPLGWYLLLLQARDELEATTGALVASFAGSGA